MKAVGGGKLADSPAQENLGPGLEAGCLASVQAGSPRVGPAPSAWDGRSQLSLSCTLDFRMQGQLYFRAFAVNAGN